MMQEANTRPILVTGSHRSGSTWVGQMIATSPQVQYIHEPFNIGPESGHFGGKFDYWFTYICDSNAAAYEEYIRRCLAFSYPLAAKLGAARNARQAVRSVVQWARFTVSKETNNKGQSETRPLMKDPLAFFSADWLARTFNMDVIVLIRHPAAFAGSLKEAHWTHPFDHFLKQPLLMRDYLSDFAAEIEAFALEERDIVDQAILLWNMIHATVLAYQSAHPEWYYVRHEDLSAAPGEEFGRLFAWLGLDYSTAVKQEILGYSQTTSGAAAEEMLSIRRDSKDNIWRWRERLTEAEIDRVYEGTRELSAHFYEEPDWWPDAASQEA